MAPFSRRPLFAVLLLSFVTGGAAQQPSLAAPTADDIKKVAMGLVEGFLFDGGDLKVCVAGAIKELQDVEQAVEDFEKKTPEEVLAGLKLLSDALKEFPPALAACKAAEADVKAVISALAQMAHPSTFAFHVGKDLVVNGKDIFKEISTAVADYKSAQFEDFGIQVGTALHKLIVGAVEASPAAAAPRLAAPSAVDIRKVAMGLVEGFLFDGADLKVCVAGGVQGLQDVEQAVQDFQKKTPKAVLAGLKLLANALKEFPQALVTCKAAEADVKAVISALAQMAHPAQFAFHVGKDLVVNGKDILKEISTAVADYKSAQFEDFGVQVGRALHKLIVGVDFVVSEVVALVEQEEVSLDVAASHSMALGFLEGFVHDSGDFKLCVQAKDVDMEHVHQAFADFKKKSLEGLLDGFKELGAAFHGLPAALKECKASANDVKVLIAALKQIKGPHDLLHRMSQNFRANERTVFQQVHTAVGDYHSKQWEDCGMQLGKAMREIVIGEDDEQLAIVV